MQALKSTWKVLLSLKAILLAAFLFLSLSLNAAMLISESLFSIVSSSFEVVTGTTTVASKYANRINELDDALDVERKAKKALKEQLADASSGMVTLRGEKMAMRDAVEKTANSISKRAVKSSAREVGSMAGEAVPYVGTAVIVGVTALELKDLCDTVTEMHELKRAFSVGEEFSDDQTTVCSIPIPSKEELMEKVKASPGKAWSSAKEKIPNLEDLKNYELPEFDVAGVWRNASEGASEALGNAKQKTIGIYERAKNSLASGKEANEG